MNDQINYLQLLYELSQQLTTDPQKNIQTIVTFAHNILGGTCSLYNKLNNRNQSLISWATENTPDDLPYSDDAKGHICYEATIKGQNKIVVIEDITKTPYAQSDSSVIKYNLKSYLGYPVKIQGIPIGSLCIVDQKVRKFTKIEILVIKHLANILKLQEEKYRVDRTQTLLYKISHSLITSSNINELSKQIKKHLNDIINTNNFSLTIFDENNKISDLNFNNNNLDIDIESAEKFLLKTILKTKKSILANAPQLENIIPLKYHKNIKFISWLGVPLLIDEEIIGIISLKSFTEEEIYIPEDITLMEFISYEIAHIIKEKKLKEELKIKEESYRTIFENSTIGIYRTDFQNNILMVNPTLTKMLEYESSEKLIQTSLDDEYHPDYERKYFLNKLKENKIIKNNESVWTTQKGNKIHVRETAYLVKMNNQTIIEGIVEDITEEINNKIAYKFEKEKFDNLTSNVPIGIIQINKDEQIFYHNTQFQLITGYKKNEIQTLTQLNDLIIPDENNKITQSSLNTASVTIINTKDKTQKFIKLLKTKSINDSCLITMEDISSSIFSKQELVTQSKYLTAINNISNLLIANQIIPYSEIFKIIKKTIEISHVDLIKCHNIDGHKNIGKFVEWDNNILPKDQHYSNILNVKQIAPNWYKKIREVDYFHGSVNDFFAPEKTFLNKYGLKSIFVHAIKIDSEIYGYLVFSCKKEERIWLDRETILIQTIANNLTKSIKQRLMNTELDNSKSSYFELFKNSSSGIVIFNENGRIENINPKAEDFFEKNNVDVIGKTAQSLTNEKQIIKGIIDSIKYCNTMNLSKNMDIILEKNNKIKILDLHFTKIKYFDQYCIVLYAHDITLRYKREEEIQHNLEEKQILLQEIHHRVKNNLQIISSLLNLQLNDIETEKDRTLFMDSQNRIKSIALIHESLYQSKNLSKINFRDYTAKLISRLISIYKIDKIKITYQINMPNSEFNLKKAIPCGLILDELIINSLKYAFPDNQTGNIIISLSKNKKYFKLSVYDNGIGFDSQKVIKQNQSLGFELITTLTKQLSGTYKLFNENGFGIEITFPQ